MNLIQGGKKQELAGAKIGETILVHLITGKIEKVILSDITKTGIEGFEVDLKDRPLTFYPYTAILKVKKYNELS
jgi:malate/lactate dehydrogenase